MDALFAAVEAGDIEQVSRLLQDVSPQNLNNRDQNRRTILHWAVLSGNEALVGLLLTAGVKPSGYDNDGFTPLLYAVQRRHVQIAQLLLEAGADANGSCEGEVYAGYTPLHFAAMNRVDDAIPLLLKYGANVNRLSETDTSPLLVSKFQEISVAFRHAVF
jgi:ankyrin repeat protein